MASFDNVGDLIRSYPDHFNPDAARGLDGVVQLDLDGDDGGQYVLHIQDQELTVEEGTHDDPTVTISTTAQDWLDVSQGEVNPMSLMMRGKLTVSGSMSLATKFRDLFDV